MIKIKESALLITYVRKNPFTNCYNQQLLELDVTDCCLDMLGDADVSFERVLADSGNTIRACVFVLFGTFYLPIIFFHFFHIKELFWRGFFFPLSKPRVSGCSVAVKIVKTPEAKTVFCDVGLYK